MSENVKNENAIETGENTKITLKVLEHLPFPGDMKTHICTNDQMAETISGLFAGSMPDFYGCRIRVHDGHVPLLTNIGFPNGGLYVDVFFKDFSDESDKKNITLRGSKDGDMYHGNSMLARFARVNGAMTSANVYEVTKRTCDMLEEFMPRESRTRWADHIQEMVNPMSAYGKEEVVVSITGLDLNKIVAKIYGTNTKEGRFEYNAMYIRSLDNRPAMANMPPEKFMMQVLQLDSGAVRDMQNAAGMYTANSPQFYVYRR